MERQEEGIKWETITGIWTDSLKNISLKASSYHFDEYIIDLKNTTPTSIIATVDLKIFYYTDGLDFRPINFVGSIKISEVI